MTEPIATGEAAADAGDDAEGAGSHALRGGHSITINTAALRALYPAIRHHPAVLALLDQTAQRMCGAANSMASEEGAEYKVTLVADWPDSSRARANVWTGNYKARVDEAKNSTLLKVLAQFHGTATQ